jgi:hypothetical protein
MQTIAFSRLLSLCAYLIFIVKIQLKPLYSECLLYPIYFFCCVCTLLSADEHLLYDYLVSEVSAVWSANFSAAPAFMAWARQGSLTVVSAEDIKITGFRVTPYGPFLELGLPGAVTINVTRTDLYDSPSWKINDSNQNTTVVRLRRPFKDKEFCVFIRSNPSGEIYNVTILDAVVQLEGEEARQGTEYWLLGGFYAMIQLAGWIATPIYLAEIYAPGEHEEVCHCSGIVAYIFTTGLAAIPHLLVWLYIKHKRQQTECRSLLRPEV